MDRLGGLAVIAPASRAGDPGSNPGPGENFPLKLLISTCQMVILKAKIIYICKCMCVCFRPPEVYISIFPGFGIKTGAMQIVD